MCQRSPTAFPSWDWLPDLLDGFVPLPSFPQDCLLSAREPLPCRDLETEDLWCGPPPLVLEVSFFNDANSFFGRSVLRSFQGNFLF